MSEIYIIAGPPGVGKTTIGANYIDNGLDIINEDEIRFKYKELGFPAYDQHAVFRTREMVLKRVIADQDFALELNLGYQEHYDYVINAKTFKWDNNLNVILFYTDSLQLCIDRARERHASGRHLVLPETVRKMYNNTLPLLKANFSAIDKLSLINVSANDLFTVAEYTRELKQMTIRNQSPTWFKDDLEPFIEQALTELRIDRPRIKPWERPTDLDEGQGYGGGFHR